MKKMKETSEIALENDLKELQTIVEAMQEKKAKNIISLDMRNIGTSITDYFVICDVQSTTQVVAITDNIEDRMYEKCGHGSIRKQGRENAFWVILDFGNIVVHVFQSEYRDFYHLEDLWSDAEKTTYEED